MNARTDLAMEVVPKRDGILSEQHGIMIHRVEIDSEDIAKEIGKPIGEYITVEARESLRRDLDVQKYTARVVAKQLISLIDKTAKVTPKDTILLVGLGNPNMSSDALGSKTMQNVIVTRHVYDVVARELDTRLAKVCGISPNVLGVTGIETFDIVKGLIAEIKPKLVIVIDSLASLKTERIACTYQMTNTGVTPGGGIGNFRKELSKKSLGVPVIAIGVPLVVYASTIIAEAFPGREIEEPMQELIVTPKDIDQIVADCAFILGNALNISLHRKLSMEDSISYTH